MKPSTPTTSDTASLVERAGRFRIYLGPAAGVGKTVAMLDEGLRRKERGADVVVGLVETHERPYTASKLDGLEVVPRRKVEYRGTVFEEMDTEAILARKPEVVLVDELAHTNIPAPGHHEKRWQDVLQILDAGISVITTVNIQHIESLADAVEEMTTARVAERVPDWVVRRADQVELVDSSPEQLRRRLLHGNVYPANRVAEALTNFFRTENLTALRELTLRFVADETEEEMISYLERLGAVGRWETTERIMVAVTPAPGWRQVMHRAARMARRAKAELWAVHALTDAAGFRASDEEMAEIRELANALGARWEELVGPDVAATIVAFAKQARITQIVVGSSRRSRWKELRGGSVLGKLMRDAGATGIDVHVIARRESEVGTDQIGGADG
ncbi:MAG: universal stress protein [Actinomycetota bacterium]|nr:universal stress protein [Actinomycetota bacterium]